MVAVYALLVIFTVGTVGILLVVMFHDICHDHIVLDCTLCGLVVVVSLAIIMVLLTIKNPFINWG